MNELIKSQRRASRSPVKEQSRTVSEHHKETWAPAPFLKYELAQCLGHDG